MRKACLAGSREIPPAHKAGIGYRMMARAELAFYDKGAVIQHPGHAENLGRAQGLIEVGRRQNPGEPLGKHRFPRPRLADHRTL